jgi:predicted Zn-dependent peptidase
MKKNNMRLSSVLWICILTSLLAGSPSPAQNRSEFVLANGLRVRLVPGHTDKKVAVLLGVRAGFFDEPANVPHVAHVTEHLTVFDLAPGSEEAKGVERWYKAGQANAETLADFMYFDLEVGVEELPLALRVQAARLAGLAFSEATLAREIPRTLQEIEFLEGPNSGGTAKFAYAPFVQAVLHGQKTIPIKAKTREISLQMVRDFQKRTFRPDRAVLVVIGDFDSPATRKAVENVFGAIPKPNAPPAPRAEPKPGTLAVQWDVRTTHVLIAWKAPPASHPDHAALTLASFALMTRLYADKEIGALVKSPQVINDIEGFFVVNLQANPDANLDTVRAKLLDRVKGLSKQRGMGVFELSQLLKMVTQATRPPSLEGTPLPANVTKLMAMTNMELRLMGWELVWGDLAAYAKRLGTLDANAVRSAITRHLDPEKATIVILKPNQ